MNFPIRSAVSFVAILVALTVPLSAQAWNGAPLCALESGPLDVTLAPSAFVVNDTASHAAAGETMCRQAPPSERVDFSAPSVRRALRQAEEREDTSPAQGVLSLTLVAEAYPALWDWVAVEQGDLALAAAENDAAYEFYSAALDSIDSALRVRSRVGRVLAHLSDDRRDGEGAVRDLNRLYPDLPEEWTIQLAYGTYLERKDDLSGAARAYRSVDVRAPGSVWAAEARERLAQLEADGASVRAMSPIEHMTRVENLFSRGPLDDAREALNALEANPPAQPSLRTRAYLLMAKLARHEGRWEDANRFFGLAHRTGVVVGDEDDVERRTARAESVAQAAAARDLEAAERRLRSMERGRLSNIGTARLMHMIDIGVRAGLNERVDAYLGVLVNRSLPPRVRRDIVLKAVGTGDDSLLLSLIEGVHERAGALGVQASYHRARILARLGRYVDAEEALLEVQKNDRSETHWYALLADQELARVRGEMVAACGPDAQCSAPPVALPAEEERELGEGLANGAPAYEPQEPPDLDELADRLAVLAEAHGDAFPWIKRAEAFIRLDRPELAGPQLYEAYLAYREAIGRPIRRAGLESVAIGDNRRRRATPFPIRRARRGLSTDERAELADIGEQLGAVGVATGFGGWDSVRARPRAYARQVQEAADAHGLDPNLLFAVMRVESVYQKDIVSYAGAIGLAQIMPRTGTLIARTRGKADFTCDDLLDAETNLDFAAWYLRSLIDRFDGHLPLAIASYNGGPHNVRRWLEQHGDNIPMDAFLEHIPFTQTHRYVRRVLSHYQAYRAQQGLEMIQLSNQVPNPDPDAIGF